MNTGWTLGVLAGATAGLGATVVVRELLPREPHLATALERLAPDPRARQGRTDLPAPLDPDASRATWLETWIGHRVPPQLLAAPFVRIPHRDLALLRTPLPRYVGQKVLLGLLGLLFPAVFAGLAAAMSQPLPFAVPAVAGVLLGVLLFLLPDVEVRRRAVAAREAFARATSAYLDLTAMERTTGAGATQALEQAATVGDSWVFVRLREELVLARLSGTPPWEGLHALAAELGLPELSDVADIMRLSGEQGAAVASTLRARSRSLRAALLTKEQARANEDSERMVIPVALLGLIFLVLLGAPAVARIL